MQNQQEKTFHAVEINWLNGVLVWGRLRVDSRIILRFHFETTWKHNTRENLSARKSMTRALFKVYRKNAFIWRGNISGSTRHVRLFCSQTQIIFLPKHEQEFYTLSLRAKLQPFQTYSHSEIYKNQKACFRVCHVHDLRHAVTVLTQILAVKLISINLWKHCWFYFCTLGEGI